MKKCQRLEIHGQVVTMTNKKCRGCQKTIKVSTKSKQKWCSYICESMNGGQNRTYNFWFGIDGAPVLPASKIIVPEDD